MRLKGRIPLIAYQRRLECRGQLCPGAASTASSHGSQTVPAQGRNCLVVSKSAESGGPCRGRTYGPLIKRSFFALWNSMETFQVFDVTASRLVPADLSCPAMPGHQYGHRHLTPYPIIRLISKTAWEAIWMAHQFLTAIKKLDNLEGMVISGSTLPYKRQTGGVPCQVTSTSKA